MQAVSQKQAPVIPKIATSKGVKQRPLWVTLYGTEGIGKSTFAANAPRPIFLDIESGTYELDTERWVFNETTQRSTPETWSEIIGALHALEVQPHDYETIVIDTLDAAESLLHAHICKRDKKGSIEEYGYGKGYVAALDEWRVFVAQVERLQKHGLTVITLAHASIKNFKDPESDGWDRYQMKLHTSASGLIRERSSIVLFGNAEMLAHESKGRVRGVSSGARFVHTERCAAFDAKNRHGLPARLPLAWDEFAAAVKAGAPDSPERIQKQIAALLADVGEETRAKVESAVVGAGGDARRLAQIADRLKAKIETSNTSTGDQS